MFVSEERERKRKGFILAVKEGRRCFYIFMHFPQKIIERISTADDNTTSIIFEKTDKRESGNAFVSIIQKKKKNL